MIARLNGASRKALQSADMTETTKTAGMEPDPCTPEALASAIRDEVKRGRKLGKLTGIKLE